MTKATTKKPAAKKTAAKKATSSTDDAGDQLGTKVTEGDVTDMTSGEEVAARSQDITDKKTSKVHVKDFVVLKSTWAGDRKVGDSDAHLANLEATRQGLISQGLRPTGDGKFAGEEDHPDGVSLILHYEVPAVPAHEALEAGGETVAHAHVTLDDQHAAEKAEAAGEPDPSTQPKKSEK